MTAYLTLKIEMVPHVIGLTFDQIKIQKLQETEKDYLSYVY